MRTVTLPPIALRGRPDVEGSGTFTTPSGRVAPPISTSTELRFPPDESEPQPVAYRDNAPDRAPPVVASPPSPPDPMQDPAFRGYVARQAAQLAELKAAQQQTAAARGSTGFRVGNALMAFGGAGPEEMQARYARAGQPVADVLQRQEAERALTTGTEQQARLAGAVRQQSLATQAADPNSPISKRVQSLWASVLGPEQSQYLTAADVAEAEKMGTIGVQKLHYLTMQRQMEAQQQLAREKLAETSRHNLATEPKLNRIPTQVGQLITGASEAISKLDELETLHKNAGLSGYIGTGGGAKYQKAVQEYGPAIAEALSARGRARGKPEDLLPSGADLHTTAAPTFERLRGQLRQKIEDTTRLLQSQGYSPQAIEELRSMGGAQPNAPANAVPRGTPAPGKGGRVNLLDQKGAPINLPAEQADAYLAANPGARRAQP